MNNPLTKKLACVIALVEDEEDFCSNVALFLEAQGFKVWTSDSAESFYRKMVGRHTDLVIVDLGLPGEDGLSLIAHLHTNTRLAIIALTARGSAADQTSGLDAGADYYFVKPVDPHVLVAGINAVLRKRAEVDVPTANGTGAWLIVRQDATLYAPNGIPIPLSSREVQLLEYLMARPETVISKNELLYLFSKGLESYDFNKIEAVVSRLRRKVESSAGMRLPVRSVYGQGLSFVSKCILKA